MYTYEFLVISKNSQDRVYTYTPRQTAKQRALVTNNNGRLYFDGFIYNSIYIVCVWVCVYV